MNNPQLTATAGKRVAILLASVTIAWSAGAATYRETDVPNGGRIVGTVRVVGNVAPLPLQPVFKEKEFCGEAVPDDRLMMDAAHDLGGAVVHVVDIEAGKAIARSEPVRLDSRKCAFVPHVVAASVGQMLEMHNEDPFLHDAHAILGPETLFNLAIPKGRTVHHTLEQPGIVHVNCNVRHTWMHAYVFVTDDPYHAVTDGSGRFVLDDVPPGSHEIAVWHELLGTRQHRVTVAPGETATVDFELDAVAPAKP
jgi:plastocyanin